MQNDPAHLIANAAVSSGLKSDRGEYFEKYILNSMESKLIASVLSSKGNNFNEIYDRVKAEAFQIYDNFATVNCVHPKHVIDKPVSWGKEEIALSMMKEYLRHNGYPYSFIFPNFQIFEDLISIYKILKEQRQPFSKWTYQIIRDNKGVVKCFLGFSDLNDCVRAKMLIS